MKWKIIKIIYCVFSSGMLLTMQIKATEINVSSRVDISEFDAKYVKSSWCIFSDGDSSTNTSTLSASLSGENNKYTQKYSRRGKTYLSRKIQWDSATTNKSFTLSFHADDANFQASEKYNDSTCSYKFWKAHTSSAETQLTAKAAFRIPKNVWAIRINSETVAHGALQEMALFVNDYIVKENGEEKLEKKKFFNFDESVKNKYFLTNASTLDKDNFVYLDFKYIKKTATSSDLDVKFRVDFISAEECFRDLKGKTFIDLIHANMDDTKLESGLVNMACMLNPKYIKHSLSTLYLYDIRDFFNQLTRLEKKVDTAIIAETKEKNLATYTVFLKLIDRVRFYYAYEILKETMNLLTKKVSYNGETMDSLFFIEVLRKRGILYLFAIYDNLLEDFEGLAPTPGSPFISIELDTLKKINLFKEHFLPYEISGFRKAHALIYSPKYLSISAFNDFKVSAERAASVSNSFVVDANIILTSNRISTAQLNLLKSRLRSAIDQLRLYVVAFDRFQNQIGGQSLSIHDSRKRLLSQLDYTFQLNMKGLITNLGDYYIKHFEDPVFQNIKVGDKYYENVIDFIKDFEEIIKEVSK